jgi:hypothetical protein
MALVEAGDLIIWFIAAFFSFLALTVTAVVLVWYTKKGQLWSYMMSRIRNRGQMIAKFSTNDVELIYTTTKKDDSVPFDIYGENGNKVDIAPVKLVKPFQTLKGTSIPFYVVTPNFPTNIDVVQKEKSPLKIGEAVLLNKVFYTGGMLKGIGIKMPESNKFDVNKAILFALFLVGVLMIVVIVMNWQVLESVSPKI